MFCVGYYFFTQICTSVIVVVLGGESRCERFVCLRRLFPIHFWGGALDGVVGVRQGKGHQYVNDHMSLVEESFREAQLSSAANHMQTLKMTLPFLEQNQLVDRNANIQNGLNNSQLTLHLNQVGLNYGISQAIAHFMMCPPMLPCLTST